MVNYQKGKIYKIISPHTDKCYVGSTTKDRLSNRLAGHRSDLKKGKNMSSKYILELGDYEIVLLELYPCNSKDELYARERHYVEMLDSVNYRIPNRSQKEYQLNIKDKIKEYKKEYYQDNRGNVLKKQQEYAIENKDKIKEYKKEYQLNNKDKIKEYQKERYIKNEKMIKQKVTCECGCLIRKGNILQHKKTKKHIDNINNQSSL